MSESNRWSSKQVVVLVIIAALGGYVLGRLSTNLRIRFGGGGGPGETADFVLDDPGPIAEDSTVLPVSGAPFLGPGAAKVTIVEFSDFQCPFCQRATPVVHALMERYEGDVRLVFLNLPLPMHPEAEPAARASLAAHRQGAFWEYHDLLFTNQRTLGSAAYEAIAEELDLDLDQFRRDFEDATIAERVANDLALARSLGVNGTPTFLVNGIQVVGVQPPEAFAAVIDDEIEAADTLLDAGVPLTEVYPRRIAANMNAPADREANEEGAAPPAEEEARTPERPPVPAPEPGPPPIPDGHAELTVYADVSDPAYRELGQTLERLMADYGDRLEVRFESYVEPADEQAVLAAAALRQAAAEGRFRELHRLLIQSDGELGRDRLEGWAVEAGLDLDAFRAALDAEDHVAFEAAQRLQARDRGVILSPTVRVGEVRLVGSVPYEDLRVAVNAHMERE